MKNITLLSATIAVLGLAVAGCSNSDLESRVTRLEGRVAELEGKGVANTRATATTQPAATNEPEMKPDGPLPVFTFTEEDYDFGKINEGDEVEHVFQFTNTGDAPLIISDAKGSCGCTVPEWPKEPIGIGEKGQIKVKFNSSKKPGIQNKTVTITANTFPKQSRIKIKADVTPAASAE
ncbi:DUF1573 domain-containing protein [Reichenbachiella agarivorans]|uniref:DUF1573 domain-containing protein n=1 Tax=Reichenbachiella agarivorans TaxID=2979464 RepID=A0ABY6CWP0_9BACT|nr:DUF1573 domain-containing protein [Reichenbachiella agarivorans]UXP33808.1 DUF1573 domain-containing protein [Reichenbachiella agarivorans]